MAAELQAAGVILEVGDVVGDVAVDDQPLAGNRWLPLAAELAAVCHGPPDVLVVGLRLAAAGNWSREGLQAIVELRPVERQRGVQGRSIEAIPDFVVLRPLGFRCRDIRAGGSVDIVGALGRAMFSE